MKLRRFMGSRSSIRQGVLGQRRTNFQGNQFPLAAGAARKAAVAPIRNGNFNRNLTVTSFRPRVVARLVQNRGSNGGGFAIMKQEEKVVPKQKGQRQTLDSLLANMKEQRMKVLSQQQRHNSNVGRRNGAGQQKPRPSWTRIPESDITINFEFANVI
ncbi:uncharacterized protein LOC143627207 [Bidens hawaiensis]|uniref:uncharacterized protein LOC143627207 n=1 Tax=Bidens hawaiensis TaxID=980011 RepID=UPI0040498815